MAAAVGAFAPSKTINGSCAPPPTPVQEGTIYQRSIAQTRIITKYNVPNLEAAKYQKPSKKRKREHETDGKDETPRIPKAALVLKTFDPESGVVLKFKTDRAADVGRLVAGLGRLGRHMAALPERTEGMQYCHPAKVQIADGCGVQTLQYKTVPLLQRKHRLRQMLHSLLLRLRRSHSNNNRARVRRRRRARSESDAVHANALPTRILRAASPFGSACRIRRNCIPTTAHREDAGHTWERARNRFHTGVPCEPYCGGSSRQRPKAPGISHLHKAPHIGIGRNGYHVMLAKSYGI